MISLGVYVEPLIVPPPDTIFQEPPEGEPVNVLVWFSLIDAVAVVFFAVILQTGVTVKVTSSLVAGQSPSAAIVYRIVTSVFVLILAAVYVAFTYNLFPVPTQGSPKIAFLAGIVAELLPIA